jgi:2,4-dienoyl-CoA reductase (NADPH2)
LLYWLEDNGVEFLTEVKYNEINKKGLVLTAKDGSVRTLEADTIITALPLNPNSDIQEKMKGKAGEVYTIGDAGNPGLIFDAVAQGARIAREI